jgi:hypothetical protein
MTCFQTESGGGTTTLLRFRTNVESLAENIADRFDTRCRLWRCCASIPVENGPLCRRPHVEPLILPTQMDGLTRKRVALAFTGPVAPQDNLTRIPFKGKSMTLTSRKYRAWEVTAVVLQEC